MSYDDNMIKQTVPGGFSTVTTKVTAPVTYETTMASVTTNGLTVKERKGGTFAPADIPLIKRALHVYLVDCQRANEDHPDLNAIANLLHRLNRI